MQDNASGHDTVGPSDEPSSGEPAMAIHNRFLAGAQRAATVMVGGRFPSADIARVAEMIRRGDLTVEALQSQLRKTEVEESEVFGFTDAVERTLRGRQLTLVSARDLLLRPDPVFLIEGLIVEGSFAVLISLPKVGKSFVAQSWAVSIAEGIPWLDRSVQKGVVVYVSAEGIGGVAKRLRALQQKLGLSALPENLQFITRPVDILDPMAVREVIGVVQELGLVPKLVVFDTYARSMPGGDENNARDAGLAIQALDEVRFSLETAVLVVHHTPKTGGVTARGSGALEGAADTVLFLERKGNDLTLKTPMMKDFEEGDPINLTLEPFGDSAVVVKGAQRSVSTGGAAGSAKPDTEQMTQQGILDSLQQAEIDGRTPISQNQLLFAVRGSTKSKADLLRRLAESEDYPVHMEQVGSKNMYSLQH